MEALVEEILQLVKIKMREQAAYDQASYRALIDETITYFHEKGKITDDDNEKFIIDRLMEMWEYVQEEFSEDN